LGVSFNLKVVQLITNSSSKKNQKGFTVESDSGNNDYNAYWKKVLYEEFALSYSKNFVKQNQFSIKERLNKKFHDLQMIN
jgi:hypothetical protein